MSRLLGTYEFFNHDLGEYHQINIVEGLEDRHLDFVEKTWVPQLKDARDRTVIAYYSLPTEQQSDQAWQEKQGKFGAPDSHWLWREKTHTLDGATQRIFAITDGEIVEALMRVDLSKQSRISQDSLTLIMYVEYLAVAPWNRKEIQFPPKFKGFGSVLLGVAISISFDEGMEGRCGLHSLPQAEGFYTKAGMDDLGVDPDYKLTYFEFHPEAASKFLEGKS